MRSVAVVAKFKTRQYVLKTDSPNLMLAKFSRYTVLWVTYEMMSDSGIGKVVIVHTRYLNITVFNVDKFIWMA